MKLAMIKLIASNQTPLTEILNGFALAVIWSEQRLNQTSTEEGTKSFFPSEGRGAGFCITAT